MILDLKNFNVFYKNKEKDVHACRNINISFDEDTSYGIVGESGSGKTTLFMAILRLLTESAYTTGDVYFKDIHLNSLNDEEFRRMRWSEFSIVFQDAMNFLSPVHKIGQQLIAIYSANGKSKDKEYIINKIESVLKKVNLPRGIMNMYPHELSGGMMQRVSISAALLCDPKLLIMDEATTALDIVTERQIFDEIIKLEKDYSLTRIMITHDISIVSTSVKNVIVMYAGVIVETGPVEQVFLSPLHPYTKLLLDSYPKMNDKSYYLSSIPGSLPDLKDEYKGCVFYDRCPYREDVCKSNIPSLRKYNERSVACFIREG